MVCFWGSSEYASKFRYQLVVISLLGDFLTSGLSELIKCISSCFALFYLCNGIFLNLLSCDLSWLCLSGCFNKPALYSLLGLGDWASIGVFHQTLGVFPCNSPSLDLLLILSNPVWSLLFGVESQLLLLWDLLCGSDWGVWIIICGFNTLSWLDHNRVLSRRAVSLDQHRDLTVTSRLGESSNWNDEGWVLVGWVLCLLDQCLCNGVLEEGSLVINSEWLRVG